MIHEDENDDLRRLPKVDTMCDFLLEFGCTGEHLPGGLEPSNGSAKTKTGLISSHLLVRIPNIDWQHDTRIISCAQPSDLPDLGG